MTIAKVDEPSFHMQRVLRLGRKQAADPRDLDYLAAAHLEDVSLPFSRARSRATGAGEIPEWAADLPDMIDGRYWDYFSHGVQLDQGATSQCVAYSFGQAVQSGSVKQDLVKLLRDGRIPHNIAAVDDLELVRRWLADQYAFAQSVDEWPGAEPVYYGTSERAGAKAFQRHGFWPNYYWLWTVAEIVRYMARYQHPVPIGCDHFTGMDYPDAQGYIHPTGAWRGGHMWLIDGFNFARGKFRMRTPWGAWGEEGRGHCWITFADMEYLLRLGAGAVAVPEIRLPKVA